jgi:hypothetical protein
MKGTKYKAALYFSAFQRGSLVATFIFDGEKTLICTAQQYRHIIELKAFGRCFINI